MLMNRIFDGRDRVFSSSKNHIGETGPQPILRSRCLICSNATGNIQGRGEEEEGEKLFDKSTLIFASSFLGIDACGTVCPSRQENIYLTVTLK